MKNKYFSRFITLFLLLVSNLIYAQTTDTVEMADKWRGEGKIYVVIGVILIILAGLFFYIMRAERKIKKLEVKL